MTRASTLRLAVALGAGKALGMASRSLRVGGGTSLPGMVARRIDPGVLTKVLAASRARTVVVTGSNGKTTTCRMLAGIEAARGHRVAQNRAGSNLLQGVTSAAVSEADLRGRMGSDVLLLEVDEATAVGAVMEVRPHVLVVCNLFRDQLDRYGERHAVARALGGVVRGLPTDATVVLNADDPMVVDLGRHARARQVLFGLRTTDVGGFTPDHAADTIRCPQCGTDLTYKRVYLSHLGAYQCPSCGYARPPLDIAVSAVRGQRSAPTEIEIETPAGSLSLRVPLPGLDNVYNAVAAVAAALVLDPAPPPPGALDAVRAPFARMERIRAGDRDVLLGFVKNPTSFNATLGSILHTAEHLHVLCAFSNALTDGENLAWLWDVDLDALAHRACFLVTSGTRAEEVTLRLKYAGAREEHLREIRSLPAALDAALTRAGPGGTLHVLGSYTPIMQLRRAMQRRGWVSGFWKE